MEFYEPTRVLLARQRGKQFRNDVRNVGPTFGKRDLNIERVEVDAYCDDHGYRALRAHVEELTQEHNVILCSFGPKPSAIALFRLQREVSRNSTGIHWLQGIQSGIFSRARESDYRDGASSF